ncbi:MAG TPA: FAD-binding protein, partial [Mycobacteriales bacterium]|nr:FAD-binding protein [Mycobacteriales bacterium]
DRTGHMILQTLYQQCVKENIDFFNEFYVLDLLMNEGRTAGVVAYELATGELHVVQAKSVLFATGGFGKVFKVTSNAHTLTGDGMGIVWRKGLPLEDMEFYQFHPTGIWKMGILLTEGARGEGGILRNKDGERFMERYAPTIKDLAPRDMVARAIYTEIRQGRGCGPAGDHVFLDLTHLPPEQLDAKLPDITEFARTYLGIEPYHDPIPIQPTAHYAMGGIPTDVDAQVLRDNTHVVPGLFAAGEAACVSVHGANRLGTNSLLDINVFGRRGGISAARYANSADWVELPENPVADVESLLQLLRDGGGTESVAAIRRELQETMDANASVYRTEATLKQAEIDISALKERYLRVGVADRGKRYNTELLEAVELGFLLDLAEVLVISARARNESRGGHFREDYPNRDDVNFMRHTMAYRTGDPLSPEIRLDYKPVVQTRYQPMERKY